MKKDLCVIEIGEGWAVRRQGELMLVSVHDTPKEAEHAALKIARKESCEVLVQDRNGKYRRSVPTPLPPAKAGKEPKERTSASRR